jgi:hypothetical protein
MNIEHRTSNEKMKKNYLAADTHQTPLCELRMAGKVLSTDLENLDYFWQKSKVSNYESIFAYSRFGNAASAADE